MAERTPVAEINRIHTHEQALFRDYNRLEALMIEQEQDIKTLRDALAALLEATRRYYEDPDSPERETEYLLAEKQAAEALGEPTE